MDFILFILGAALIFIGSNLLIDNSKFYKNDGSFIICPLNEIDTVITDQSIAKLNFLKKYNFRTVITRN